MQLNAPKWTPRQSVTQQGGLITIALNQSGVRFTGLSYLCWGVNGECEDNGDRNQQFNESNAAMVSIFTESGVDKPRAEALLMPATPIPEYTNERGP